MDMVDPSLLTTDAVMPEYDENEYPVDNNESPDGDRITVAEFSVIKDGTGSGRYRFLSLIL